MKLSDLWSKTKWLVFFLIRSINKEAVLIEETEYEKYRENNIPTKNKLPQLPEEIVHKIMLMAYEIAPHPIATLIHFDKYRIHGEYYQEQIKDGKYYARYLAGILGDSNESFYKWWFEKMAYRVKYRLCAEEIEAAWNKYKSQSV
jgi:hypothetical protein